MVLVVKSSSVGGKEDRTFVECRLEGKGICDGTLGVTCLVGSSTVRNRL